MQFYNKIKSIKFAKKYKILLVILLLLLIIRLILPYVVLRSVNNTLATMNGYFGHIEDVDLSLLRGAYIIDKMYLNKVDKESKKQTEFLKSRNIDLSIEWGALLKGSVVGKIVSYSPLLIFTKDKVELSDITRDTSDFRKLLKDLMPLKVNRFEVHDGAIQYIDNTSNPVVDVSLKKAHILALNLTNVINKNIELPSTVVAEASVYEGSLHFSMKLNAMAVQPAFDLNADVKNINLALLNDLLKAYGGFDVHGGKMGLYTEMATKNGKFKGYVKPVIKDLDVIGPEDRKDKLFNKIWESIVSVVGEVFKNQSKDQIATKIRMEGSFNDPDTNTLDAIWEVIRNAFIQALIPSVENAININSVNPVKQEDKRKLFQKIYSAEKKKDDKKKK